ncbi:hypothetical protein [Streptomyces sp. NPDC050485]|uniref:hypothetical protein n=1 Tax=Streptomyces sp. NPDC050485 TaxID=3365617 RepID=UPI0037AA32D9
MPPVLRAPLQGLQFAHCIACQGWLLRRVWLTWPGDVAGDYPEIRPDVVHHLRRRAVSRKAEQLLRETEAMQWERALVRMAADVPRVSRSWQPAPDGWALLANRARADWDRAAYEG